MKKLLLFLLILTIFLVGCQPVDEPSGASDSDLTENQPSDSTNDTGNNPGNTGSTQNSKPPEQPQKPSFVAITNRNDPQDEDADFLFVFEVKEGVLFAGERMLIEVEMINNMETSFKWTGSSSTFCPSVKLVCRSNDEEYTISHVPLAYSDDIVDNEVKPGESHRRTYAFYIPKDIPVGEYTLVCQYRTTKTEFDGYFSLK